MEHLKEKRRKAKAIYDLMNQQQNIRREVESLKVQMAWVQVQDEENTLKELEEELESLKASVEQAQREVESASERYATANEARETADEAKQRLQEDLDTVNQELALVKERLAEAKKEATDAQHDQRAIGDQIKANDRTIDQTKKDIEAEKQRIDEINGGSIARRLAELEERKQVIESVRQKQRDHAESRDALVEDEKKVGQEREESIKRRDNKETEKSACDDRLRGLRQQGQQRQFIQNMDRLQRAVAAEQDWREQPIGPIGNYVQLMEPQWLSVLERTFGGVLNGFIVTNKADQSKLS